MSEKEIKFQVVCGASDNWPPEEGNKCPKYDDHRCCAVCPEGINDVGCPEDCGIHGRRWGTDDPRIFCDFFSVVLEEGVK